MNREAVHKEVDKAAEEYVFARWRAGEQNAEGSWHAALSYVDARWPQKSQSFSFYPTPRWPKIIGVIGIPVVYLWVWSYEDFGNNQSPALALTFFWILSWAFIHLRLKLDAEDKSAPFNEWNEVLAARMNLAHRFDMEAVTVSERLASASRERERKAERERVAECERQAALRRPQPTFDCTHQEAEVLAARWMKHLGESDASVSQATRDGGADVESGRFVAEVKHQSKPVGPVPVRAIVGVAYSKRKVPVFFSLNGYTRDATEFGREAGALLFEYDPERGTLQGATALSRKAIREGLESVLQVEEG